MLHIGQNKIIEESIDIMHWSINNYDPDLWKSVSYDRQIKIVKDFDIDFKKGLEETVDWFIKNKTWLEV